MRHVIALAGRLAACLAMGAGTASADGSPFFTSSTAKGTDTQRRLLVGLTPLTGGSFVSKDDQVYRLVNIRPPMEGDVCKDAAGAVYDCAARARTILQTLSMGLVTCTTAGPRAADGAIPARCSDMADRDIGRMMVASGWALPAEGDFDYTFDAMEAQARGKGLWQGRFRIARR